MKTLYVIAHIGTQRFLGGLVRYVDDPKDPKAKAYEHAYEQATQVAKGLAEEGYTGPHGQGNPSIWTGMSFYRRSMQPIRRLRDCNV